MLSSRCRHMQVAALLLAAALFAASPCGAESAPTAAGAVEHLKESSTDLPPAVTTEAPAVDSANSADPGAAPQIFKAVFNLIMFELEHGLHQWLNALVAFGLGLILVLNGKKVFEGLIVLSVAYVLMVMAMNAVGQLWGLDMGSNLRHFVGIEMGLIGAWGAWKGLAGMDIWAGTLIGFAFCHAIQQLLVHMGLHFLDTLTGVKWVIVLFYTILVGGFVYMFNGEAHKKLLAIIAPLGGGALMISSLSWGFTVAITHPIFGTQLLTFAKKVLPELSPVEGAWVKFLQMLCSPSAKDFGIFAGSPYNKLGDVCTIDRLCGWTFWFVLWGFGVYVQLGKKKGKKMLEAPVQAREPLHEALLEAPAEE